MALSELGNHKRVLVVGLLLGVGVLTRDAEAANIVIPGYACDMNEMDANGSFFISTGLSVEVDSKNVYCPIVRMSHEGTLNNVWVRLWQDSATDLQSVCYVYSLSADGTSMDSVFGTTSSAGYVSINIGMSDFTEYASGAYSLACALQEDDALMSVRYYEP